MTDSRLETWDFVAVGCYFVAVLGVGLYSMCQSHRGTISGYFLAGRFMTWLPVGASLYASNIGSEHFIGLAGSGAAAGIGVGAFELNALIMLQLLGWIFLPVYIASGVCTLPEFMKKRYGGRRIRIYLASLSLILYIFTKISVNLYSGALFIQQALHWNLYISVLLLLAATAFCTVTGGLTAVIYTDTLQSVIMVIGSTTLAIIAFIKVGGYTGLYYKYQLAIPNTTLANPNMTCGYPREDAWQMLRDPVDSDIPWPGFLFGQTPASIWYWCADQMMVQRALAAKSLSHAQGGTLFAGYLKLLPLFFMVMPGMIARVLYPNEVACADPITCEKVCGNRIGCSNIAYPMLVLDLMPTGLRGVMLSVMLAALMSDLTSIFNSASTLFTIDIYQLFRKNASIRELMIVGRAFVVVMVGIGFLWVPIVQGMQGGQLYLYIQAIAAYLAPPIAAVYCCTLLWKRANESGAFWGLMMGMMVGVVRMTLDFIYKEPACGEPDLRPVILSKLHYMYFAMLLFWITGLVMVVVSLMTPAPTDGQLIRVTYWTRHDRRIREDEKGDYNVGDETCLDAHPEQNLVKRNTSGHDNEFVINYAKTPDGKGDDSEHVLITDSTPGGASGKPQDKQGGDGLSQRTGHKAAPQNSNPVKVYVKRGCNWFCGFDDSEEGIQKVKKQEAHLRQLTSLKQDKKVKLFLNVNLIFLVALCVFLYIFFSTGSSFGLL